MGLWSIVVPQRLTNLIYNPSFEHASLSSTDNWTITAGSLARTATQSTIGSFSGWFQPTASSDYIESNQITASTTDGNTVYVQFDLRSAGTVTVKAWDGASEETLDTITGDSAWHTYKYSPASDSFTLRFYSSSTDNQLDRVCAYDIPGAVFATEPVENYTYIDGDQPGCFFDGVRGACNSVAPIDARVYGEIVNLDDYYAYITESDSVGMENVQNTFSETVNRPGGVFSSQDVGVRVSALTMDVVGTSQEDLHLRRKNLIDLLKLDKTPTGTPFRIVYTGASSTKMVYLDCYYSAGLEYNHGGAAGFTEDDVVARFQSANPFWYEFQTQSFVLAGAVLASASTDVYSNIAIVRVDYPNSTSPQWREIQIGVPSTNQINAIAIDDVRGRFAIANDTGITMYSVKDSTSWGVGATILSGSTSYSALAIGARGELYAAGIIDVAGSTVDEAIAYNDTWTSGQWQAMGAGLTGNTFADADVKTIYQTRDGTVYAGGDFTANGDSDAINIAKWDGTAWSAIAAGVGAPSGPIFKIIESPSGTLYACGTFGAIGGDTDLSYITQWDGTTWSALGGGVEDSVYAMEIAKNGDLYAGGTFENAAGDTNCQYIARWNGYQWFPLQSGLNNFVFTLKYFDDLLFIGGSFVTEGDTNVQGTLYWNNYTFLTPDQTAVSNSLVGGPTSVDYGERHKIAIISAAAGGMTSYGKYSAVTSVDVSATAKVYPRFRVKSDTTDTNRILSIKNHSSNKSLYMNYTVKYGEEVIIDVENGRVTSSFAGDITGTALARGSQFSTFSFLPGENILSAFVSDITSASTSSVEFTCEVPIRHHSLDGAAT